MLNYCTDLGGRRRGALAQGDEDLLCGRAGRGDVAPSPSGLTPD